MSGSSNHQTMPGFNPPPYKPPDYAVQQSDNFPQSEEQRNNQADINYNLNYPQQTLPYPVNAASSVGYQPQIFYIVNAGNAPHENPNPDAESNNGFAASTGKSVRRRFIAKVYAIVASQLLLTAFVVAIFIFVPPIRAWIQANRGFIYVSYPVFIVTLLMLYCCEGIRRSYPCNLIALLIFTLSMAYMTGCLSAQFKIYSVLECLSMTIAVCVSVSLVTAFWPGDIRKCQAYLALAGFVLSLIALIFLISFLVSGRDRLLHTLYACIVFVLLIIYLAFDTRMIFGGGGGDFDLDEEDYIIGAIQIFVDVIQIFWVILLLFGESD